MFPQCNNFFCPSPSFHLPPWASSFASCSFWRRKNMNCNDFKRDKESMDRSVLHSSPIDPNISKHIQTSSSKSKVGYFANPKTAGHAIRYPFDSSPHDPFTILSRSFQRSFHPVSIFALDKVYGIYGTHCPDRPWQTKLSWNQTERHGRGLWRARCNQGETTHQALRPCDGFLTGKQRLQKQCTHFWNA